jgi:hypothetical protein
LIPANGRLTHRFAIFLRPAALAMVLARGVEAAGRYRVASLRTPLALSDSR